MQGSGLRRLVRCISQGAVHHANGACAICLLVFIRWRDVDPKLGVLRCLQTLSMTQIEVDALTHQNLLRSLDVLLDHHEAGDDMLPKLLCHLVNQHLSLAF